MKLELVLFIIFLPDLEGKFRKPDCSRRIIGGERTTIEKVPYNAAIFVRKDTCGGTLVAPKVVISAAHCFHKINKKDLFGIYIHVGSTDMYKGGKFIQVIKITSHPEFDNKTFSNDISILEIEKEVDCDDKTTKCLKLPSSPRINGDIVTVSGWGATSNKTRQLGELRMLKIPFIDNQTCKNESKYSNSIFDGMICAGYWNQSEKDTCRGDSGGPLAYNDELIGIVSFGNDTCGLEGYPGVYTDVYSFKDWIRKVIPST